MNSIANGMSTIVQGFTEFRQIFRWLCMSDSISQAEPSVAACSRSLRSRKAQSACGRLLSDIWLTKCQEAGEAFVLWSVGGSVK